MDFLIAASFTDSLARLTNEEQKAVKNTAFDLQINPVNPGMQFNKLDKARDKNFWSVRVGSDIRLIVHRSERSLLLCYVNHHEKAYAWAEHRKLEIHPKTGAAQMVEIRETMKEVIVPIFIEKEQSLAKKPAASTEPLFFKMPDEELLGYGVPIEWIKEVKKATEDTLLALADHLPAEAAEALLELATGGMPRVPSIALETVNPFEHPDAQRRFRLMVNVEELKQALDFPWEKWTIFLHPDQRQWVERVYTGPARVSGSAGTGKTIVALHRAVLLARMNPEARVLLTTFSDTLANALKTKLKRLLVSAPRLGERIDIYSLNAIGLRLYQTHVGKADVACRKVVGNLIEQASKTVGGHKFTQQFLLTEWEQVVDAWQLDNWDAYRDVVRLGRKTRLSEGQRAVLWAIYKRVRAGLRESNLITLAEVFSSLAAAISKSQKIFFDYAVVDESQDIGIPHIRFFAALGQCRPNALFFAGDQGQRIFQQPFSWKALGVDVRGRSRTLRINYRTSHQIRTQADRLLGPTMTDVDGIIEDRHDTVSVFNGPVPVIQSLKDEKCEAVVVGTWITDQVKAGQFPHEIGIFVRSEAQIDRAKAALKESGLAFKVLDEHVETMNGHVSVSTMHMAKGLEFKAVTVMACDDEIIPLQERIETVGDDADLKEVYDTERHLLYVACTRARDSLLVTCVEPGSEFLDDMKA
ncbi:MAG: UvrD-helicase domain-containing protein [Sedimentisphaerales bacterium]|nr:UvrD-helicase domain-containing protein [Sedimentisphaerales bacterium]